MKIVVLNGIQWFHCFAGSLFLSFTLREKFVPAKVSLPLAEVHRKGWKMLRCKCCQLMSFPCLTPSKFPLVGNACSWVSHLFGTFSVCFFSLFFYKRERATRFRLTQLIRRKFNYAQAHMVIACSQQNLEPNFLLYDTEFFSREMDHASRSDYGNCH